MLLSWFWPNFKGRFLGQSVTHANSQGDHCPGNLCLGNICPYKRLDPTNFWTQKFFDHIFQTQNFLAKKHFFELRICFRPKLFSDQTFFLDQKIILVQKIFFRPKIFVGPKIFFRLNIFFRHKIFFGPKNFSDQKIF